MKVYVVYGIKEFYTDYSVIGIFVSMKSAEKFIQKNEDLAMYMHIREDEVQG